MSVGLVSHIPDNLVIRCIEDMMQGNGQFNHPQAGTEMTGVRRDNFNNILTQLRT